MDHQQHETLPVFSGKERSHEKSSSSICSSLERDLSTSNSNNSEPQRIGRNAKIRRARHLRHRVRTTSYTAMIILYTVTALLCISFNKSLALETEGTSGPIYLCDGIEYVDALVVKYDYRLKIAPGYEITNIVSELELVLIKKLESFLKCKIAKEEVRTFLQQDQVQDLGVAGMDAGPDDEVQSNPQCLATYCEVDVDGALTVYLSEVSQSEMVSYAFQHVIAQSMTDYSDTSLLNTVQGLRGLSYEGPPLIDPRDENNNRVDYVNFPGTIEDESNANSNSNGLTSVEVVVLATIVSAVVGLIGTLMLSKRFFTSKGDNCFAVCDGTGLDKDYMNESGDKQPEDDGDEVKSVNIQWIVDMHSNNLSVIEEGTEAQSTITNQTGITPSKAMRTNDDQSIGSLSTVLASNKFLPYTT